MLNLIKDCLEGTDYDTIVLDNKSLSVSEFFENVKGNFLVISSENSKKLLNLNAIKEIKLKKHSDDRITAIKGIRL